MKGTLKKPPKTAAPKAAPKSARAVKASGDPSRQAAKAAFARIQASRRLMAKTSRGTEGRHV